MLDGRLLVVGGYHLGSTPLNTVEIYDPLIGRWIDVAAMAGERTLHTATLLPDGRVLAVGGEKIGRLATAEIYDPRVDSWVVAASMGRARSWHTATLLQDGTVLVVAGNEEGGGGSLPSTAELYDPIANTWISTGPMSFRHSAHTATLLDDGRVLVLGSQFPEIYDPVDRAWFPATPAPRIFHSHTSTLLVDGRVLFVGGYSDPDSQAYVYDLLFDNWVAAGNLNDARVRHGAVLLADGRVLVVGGSGLSLNVVNAEVFDPGSATWLPAGALTSPRERHTTTLLATGEAMVCGGESLPGETARCELYRPQLPEPVEIAGLAELRYDIAGIVLADGRGMVAGGRHSGSVATVEAYDPETETWVSLPSLGTGGGDRRGVLLTDGDVLIVGKFDAERFDFEAQTWSLTGPRRYPNAVPSVVLLPNGRVLAVTVLGAEVYDPETDTWDVTGMMRTPRFGATLNTLPSGEILAAGGQDTPTGGSATGALSSVEIYDPVSNRWRETGEMYFPRRRHIAAALPSGEVLVAGGNEGELVLASAEIYNSLSGTWRLTQGQMTTQRHWAAAVTLDNGEILVTAGNDGQSVLSSTEVYDPVVGIWRRGPELSKARERHTVLLLGNGEALIVGGRDGGGRALGSVERLRLAREENRQPIIESITGEIRYGQSVAISGTRFGGGSEAHGGDRAGGAVNYPVIQLHSLESGRIFRLQPDAPASTLPRPSFFDDPMTLTVSRFPPALDPGFYRLSISRAGVGSAPRIVPVVCSVAISLQPEDQLADLGGSATFRVEAQGARTYQWRRNGVPIAGATSPLYVTPPLDPDDAGTVYDVVVSSGCAEQTSQPAVLNLIDTEPPALALLTPRGGEYWLLPIDGQRRETIAWSMEDNIRICRVEIALEYSDDGAVTWSGAPPMGGLPRVFVAEGGCAAPGLTVQNLDYELSEGAPPSGNIGSLYRIVLTATDYAGSASEVEGSPFFIVQPNPEGVKTLIVAHFARMQAKLGLSDGEVAALRMRVGELAGHPRVQGLVIDLSLSEEVDLLYSQWDAASTEPPGTGSSVFNQRANAVLFAQNGIHDQILGLLNGFSGVEHLVLVGGDTIIPMARLRDGATLYDETRYPIEDGELNTQEPQSVTRALLQGLYLSDDPVAVTSQLRPEDLEIGLYLPDLAVGRLVETPSEILTVIEAFLRQDGVLDLTEVPPATDHRVLVTGYDFLSDVAMVIEDRWRSALDIDAMDPAVDGQLVGVDPVGSPWTGDDLLERLCANGRPFSVLSLNGHANHYGEGFPGSGPQNIQGLEAAVLAEPTACSGSPLDLLGRVIYSVGCHGGLPVSGSSYEPAPFYTRDLAQTYLGRGAVTYVANTGYGWGLVHGIGYSERLVEIMTEELTRGGVVPVGKAVAQSKLRYFLETHYLDHYDLKSMMQWTLFGLPMYVLRTGIEPGVATLSRAAARVPIHGAAEPTSGSELRVRRRGAGQEESGESLPEHLVVAEIQIDLSADGLYLKRNAAGEEVAALVATTPMAAITRSTGWRPPVPQGRAICRSFPISSMIPVWPEPANTGFYGLAGLTSKKPVGARSSRPWRRMAATAPTIHHHRSTSFSSRSIRAGRQTMAAALAGQVT
ncbi:MAG: hypothetical protein HC897_00280 [Thermoanaerobaculia bacterium]|nr:hypothetical protein [Thermoanaerobaculia bacterium]